MNDKNTLQFPEDRGAGSQAADTRDQAALNQAITERLQNKDWDRLMAQRVLDSHKSRTPHTSITPAWRRWPALAAAALVAILLLAVGFSAESFLNQPEDAQLVQLEAGHDVDWMLEESEAEQEIEAMLAGAVFVD